MKRLMVRYKVKPDRAAENERYVANVFEQLQRERPAGLRYATFKLDDGVSFVHVVSHETDGDHACATKLLWTRVQGGVTKALAGTTLAELVEFADRHAPTSSRPTAVSAA